MTSDPSRRDDDPIVTRAADEASTHLAGDASRYFPARLGPYRVVGIIGEGAMGVVYEAEQDRPHRRVALKVIRPEIVAPSVLRRFEHEAEVLGRLQHAGIAQIYEAGVADAGGRAQPYFAMELVRGRPLNVHALEEKLTRTERLTLFTQVCDAVQHAHEKGVVHRDLKPANILVDSAGQPKVLDFGLARAVNADLRSTMHTGVGEMVGTVAYMSPEQIAGDINQLDTRSDVYALGVIAYELLAERSPYDLHRKPIAEMARIVREEEPARLSSLVHRLPADLDTIVAKALEKDRSRRYESASDMAADVRRFLRDEPIVARPPSTIYQIRKFAKRHKAVVGGVAAVFAVLVIGVIVSSWQAVRARRAESVAAARAVEAQREAAKAQAVTKFMQDMLSAANPENAQGREVSVRAALDEAAKKVDSGTLGGEPDVESAVRAAIGRTYEGLGLFDAAERQLRRALEIRSKTSTDRLLMAESMFDLARTLYLKHDVVESERLLRESLAIRREVLGPKHRDVAATINALGAQRVRAGDFATGEPLLREALALRREILGPTDPDVASTANNLGMALRAKGDFVAAEPILREALELRKQGLGNEHPDVAIQHVNVARVLQDLGKYAESEKFAQEALAIRRRVLGPEHPAMANTLSVVADGFAGQGKFAEAEGLYREAVAIARKAFGEQHSETGRFESTLAWVLVRAGEYAKAEPLLRDGIAIQRKTLGVDHDNTRTALTSLARALNGMGDYAGADAAAREAIASYRKQTNPRLIAGPLTALGDSLLERRRFAEASAALQEARAVLEKQPPTPGWLKGDVASLLGASLAGDNKPAEAEPLLVAGYESLRDFPGSPRSRLRKSLERLVAFYTATGRPKDAEPWRARLQAMGQER